MSMEKPSLSVGVEVPNSGADEDVERKALMKLSLKQQTKVLIIHVGGV